MKKPLILIVEDEAAIKEMLQLSLDLAGFATRVASDTKEAEEQNAAQIPDLILLDWMLPGQSGVDYIRKLRNNPITQQIPIILLTAKAEEENKVKGLDAGADDYIIKPFSPRELISRIKTVLRRGPLVNTAGIITIKDLVLDTNNHSVFINGQPLELTPISYNLLYFFIRHQNRVYTREQLLHHVWGGENYVNDRTVDVQIRRLREVLKPYGYDGLIQTVYGSGYRFSEN